MHDWIRRIRRYFRGKDNDERGSREELGAAKVAPDARENLREELRRALMDTRYLLEYASSYRANFGASL